MEFLEPQPSDELLALEYKNYYDRRSTNTKQIKKAYFSDLLQQLNIDFNDLRVLEIGGGEGDCAQACLESWPNTEYTVVESNEECLPFFNNINCRLINASLEDFLLKVNKPASFKDQSFGSTFGRNEYDVILLFDVIEHLRDPESTLQILIGEYLSDRGQVIASFPDANSPSRKFMGGLWPQYKLEHLFYFTPKSIQSIERKLQLKTDELFPLEKTLPIEFLIQVGSNFGPLGMQKITRLLGEVLPRSWKSKKVKLPLGELLWVSHKEKTKEAA